MWQDPKCLNICDMWEIDFLCGGNQSKALFWWIGVFIIWDVRYLWLIIFPFNNLKELKTFRPLALLLCTSAAAILFAVY
ncbi:hypothetical protein ACLB2K_020552 [Fragaria x ananassa]